MKKRREKQDDNYLDYIPVWNEEFRCETDENGNVTIFVENKGFFNRIAQLLFHRPRVSRIHLDEMGNFIWPLLTGERTVGEVAVLVKEKFGDRAEPLYERLVTYMRNLERYRFIRMKHEPGH